jgi:hypothetical protein
MVDAGCPWRLTLGAQMRNVPMPTIRLLAE